VAPAFLAVSAVLSVELLLTTTTSFAMFPGMEDTTLPIDCSSLKAGIITPIFIYNFCEWGNYFSIEKM
jgi:hypothetical protein